MPSRGGFRPRWPFRPNRASPQWANLAYWWPVSGEDLKNPVELVQSARATRDTGSDLSFVSSSFAGGSVPGTTGSVSFTDRLKLGLQTLSLSAGSLSIWARSAITSTGSSAYVFGRNKAGNNAGDVAIALASGTSKMSGFVSDGTNTRSCDSTLVMDTGWHHYLLAWDATGVNLYVDGFNKFSAAGGAAVAAHASTGFALGMPNDTIGDLVTDGAAWQGNYTDARIYARKLDDGDAIRLWEPSSRWELYRPVGRPVSFLPTTVANPAARISQAGALSVYQATPKGRVSQAGGLSVYQATPASRVSQAGALAVYAVTNVVRVSQVGAMVVYVSPPAFNPAWATNSNSFLGSEVA